MKYTNSEKKLLYESIMMDVAKIIKEHLNEHTPKWKEFISHQRGYTEGKYTFYEKFLKKIQDAPNACAFVVLDTNNKENWALEALMTEKLRNQAKMYNGTVVKINCQSIDLSKDMFEKVENNPKVPNNSILWLNEVDRLEGSNIANMDNVFLPLLKRVMADESKFVVVVFSANNKNTYEKIMTPTLKKMFGNIFTLTL